MKNEMCRCGHTRGHHGNHNITFGNGVVKACGVVFGHGPCKDEECECNKFTWTSKEPVWIKK